MGGILPFCFYISESVSGTPNLIKMVFSDLFFLFIFIPAFIVCYLLAGWCDRLLSRSSYMSYELAESGDGGAEVSAPVFRKSHACKNFMLVVFSLIFYAWGEPVYVLLMLGSVLINYFVGRGIDRCQQAGRKVWLIAGIAVNLLILGSFKYLNFFAEILRDCGLDVADPKIALPIGISFYIFQSISYLVDVYRRESEAQKSFWGLLLYISMFPQLIAGPIVRYSTVAKEIHDRHVTADDIAEGVFRFLLGLGKKVILANQLGEIATRMIGGDMAETSVVGALIGLLCFMLQIYFDFSGYSDMAIGIGRCLGFHFCENFDHPYCCKTITEFWRRWHISLGSFFRDYVYIPLGGNRSHQFVNILVVWFLTGMWHGASWNFILWGLYFGIILLVEKHTIMRIKDKIPAPLLHIYALVIVYIGWMFFYFTDTGSMMKFISLVTGQTGAPLFTFEDENLLFEKFWLLLVALIFCTPVRQSISRLSQRLLVNHTVTHNSVAFVTRVAISGIVLVASVALLIGATNNAFLYTRF